MENDADVAPWWCAEMCDPYPDDDAPGGGGTAGRDPDPHAAVAEAMLAHAEESMAAGDDHLPGVESLRRLLDDPAELGRVLADGGADDEAVGKAVWSVLKGDWDQRENELLADEMLAEMEAES